MAIEVARLSAQDLKKEFSVLGKFYELQVGEERLSCRVQLELISPSLIPEKKEDIDDLAPDLLVIMMNPGSSLSLEDDRPVPCFSSVEEIRSYRGFTWARPDNTQYQIMRVMKGCGYRHARILNISDLRNPKSVNFIRECERLLTVGGAWEHSIFSLGRIKELKDHLRSNPRILVGWGLNPKLKPLIELCLNRLKEVQGVPLDLLGLQAPDRPLFYKHPLPQNQNLKVEWVEKMIDQIKKQEK